MELKPPPWSSKWLHYTLHNVDMVGGWKVELVLVTLVLQTEAWKTATPRARWQFARSTRNKTTLQERVEKFDIGFAYRAEVPREDEIRAAQVGLVLFIPGRPWWDPRGLQDMAEGEAAAEWPEDAPRKRPLFRHRKRPR